MLKLSDFDFDLPDELIAQYPAKERSMSRLLVVNRQAKTIKHYQFVDLPKFLDKGDRIVLNDTKVLPARLFGKRKTGGRVEVLLLKPIGEKKFYALIKPLGRLRIGEEIELDGGYSCHLIDAEKKIVGFNGCDPSEVMCKSGFLPLPPYIKRPPTAADKQRYQTVFAKNEGSVAAPTAGLHFTKKLLSDIKEKETNISYLTLHVNYATFSPVRCDDVSEHKMQGESYKIAAETIEKIKKTKKDGNRIFSVGTTTCKALEDAVRTQEWGYRGRGIEKESTLFIYPPFSFKLVDCLVTNFHLPRTSLLMLVCAFAGRELMLRAYKDAVENRYRFYSYGDAMLII